MRVILSLIIAFGAFANNSDIVATALQFASRTTYGFGANSVDRMDCSAFVKRVFSLHGINLPRTSAEQSRVGREVSLSELKPGDLLFFSTYRPGPSHVGIYIGNGKMVHSSSRGNGVIISDINESYWSSRYLFARRVDGGSQISQSPKAKQTQQLNTDEIGDFILIITR
ncbi:MAG: C40 family peptidase [Aquificaceae bacterium]|nr:C40 family peptidase [Aquificaceae bacterium]